MRFVMGFLIILLWILGLIGEIMCIYKAINCNWEPKYKAEATYTISALCGIGAVVGYFNIEDK